MVQAEVRGNDDRVVDLGARARPLHERQVAEVGRVGAGIQVDDPIGHRQHVAGREVVERQIHGVEIVVQPVPRLREP